jgi:hypothetical protein
MADVLMRPRAVRYQLRAMAHCTCRIDAHCLGELERLQSGLQTSILTRLQVLRSLRSMQRCPCYFATHCIETLCTLVDGLSLALRTERSGRKL